MDNLATLPDFETIHEKDCFINAEYFTAIRGSSPFNRKRLEFTTYDEAMAYGAALNDGRTMLYAVTPLGLSAHISNI